MRFCILGAGSLGSVIGGALAASGHEVVLVSRNRAHVEAVNESGLVLVEKGVESRVRLLAATGVGGLETVDAVIVLVKSLDTETAVASARGIIGPDTILLSLQNGLGHEDLLARLVGPERVLAGKTYLGGVLTAPGRVIAGIDGKETVIGEPDGRISERVSRLADAFRGARMACEVSRNIRGAMWDKLFVNVATGALGAITGLGYGDLYDVPQLEETALAAVAEGIAVARALNVEVVTRDPSGPWRKAAEGLPREFKTSMLQSVEKQALTEIDFINGAVVDAGRRTGIATPVNATLVALVKGIERRFSSVPRTTSSRMAADA